MNIKEIVARSSKGGTVALFSGDTGAGKVKAGMDIASAIDAPFLRVNLNTVKNKYIGETEKNLKRLFSAAKKTGAVLFFDEADALFGKRSKVKDAHDRYANIEVSYLLKRLKRFPGIVILATSKGKHIDCSFLKNVPQVLKFPIRNKQGPA